MVFFGVRFGLVFSSEELSELFFFQLNSEENDS